MNDPLYPRQDYMYGARRLLINDWQGTSLEMDEVDWILEEWDNLDEDDRRDRLAAFLYEAYRALSEKDWA